MIVAERPAEQETPRLWEGDMLRCPECDHRDAAYRFRPLTFNPDLARVAVPIRKCPKCKFLFAPLAPPEEKP